MSLRARDVRLMVKEHGAEQGLIKAIEMLCEEQVGMRQLNKEMADLVVQCADQVTNMVTVGDSMAKQMDEIRRREAQYDAVTSQQPSGDA